ncbi:transglutaminase superfamily protein [Herbihabitans rhizosphaerae]|uniref:Transglutaminase superfamily protein n=1 Tax=Herbihabitans rhizosphaerae TaxID=1872711 RepID=A0A4Q7KGK7_9PSEU|nr:lasso peptide biosynthesis B2 protein [Herbihabitans rhizosphaerae]RZS33980.1 transglutaminase superfamily protein [Herbihabitans rhizosphaerae]
MTIPVTAEESVPLTLGGQVLTRVSVGLARLLVLLPPRRLRQTLRLISTGARPATEEQARFARQAAVTVSHRCAGLGCLQRSVAAAIQCRLRGTWPDWCTGFRERPFGAHAWVEVNGSPVGEPSDMSRFHTVMAVRGCRP